MAEKRFIIINDQVVEAESVTQPVNQGLEHIIGKATPEDRKYVSKVDPTLVTETIQGVLKTHKPILTYTGVLSPRMSFWETVTGIFVAGMIGAGFTMCLYYWRVIEIFAK